MIEIYARVYDRAKKAHHNKNFIIRVIHLRYSNLNLENKTISHSLCN